MEYDWKQPIDYMPWPGDIVEVNEHDVSFRGGESIFRTTGKTYLGAVGHVADDLDFEIVPFEGGKHRIGKSSWWDRAEVIRYIPSPLRDLVPNIHQTITEAQ